MRTVRTRGLTLAVCRCAAFRQVDTGEGEVVVALSGVVASQLELRASLAALGQRPAGATAVDLVVSAFLEWGVDGLVRRLAGAYGLVIWDGRDRPGGRLLMVRDRLGVEPLCWASVTGGVVFASTEAGMLRHPEVEPVVRLDGLRFLFGHDRTPGTRLWARFGEVPPGGMLTAGEFDRDVRRYWRLASEPHEDDASEACERVADLLGDSAAGYGPGSRDGAGSSVGLGVLLGGLDSSVLAALATDVLAGVGGRGDQATGRVLGLTLDDRKSDGDAADAAQAAAALGLDYRAVRADPDHLADVDVRERALRARAMPMGVGDLDFSLLLLLDAAAEHAGHRSVWWSGEGADAVFAAGRLYDHPSAEPGTFPWLVGMERITAERDLFTPGFAAALNLQEYVADQYRTAVAEIDPVPGESAGDTARRRVQHLVLTRFLRQLVDRADRIARAAGVRVRMPYCDHRLVEYLYNTAWQVKRPLGGGPGKPVLRDAFGHRVPAQVLERRKVPYPLTATPAYTRLVQHQLAEFLPQRSHGVWILFDRDRTRTITETPPERVEPRQLRALERVLDVALWFDRYTPIIEL